MATAVIVLCLLSTLVGVSQGALPDWLVEEIPQKSKVTEDASGLLTMTNGLITKVFSLKPDFASLDYYSHEKQASLLRALMPEAIISLGGLRYNIGGLQGNIPYAYLNRSALNVTVDPMAFHFYKYNITEVEAPFPYTPMRGAPSSIKWPPPGVRLNVDFKAPTWAPEYHQNIVVTVTYELYDGIPLLAKWVSVKAYPPAVNEVKVAFISVEYLALNQPWVQSPNCPNAGNGWMFVETDQPHATEVTFAVSSNSGKMPGSFEPTVNCSYTMTPDILVNDLVVSFRVHELVHASTDPERVGLAKHRMLRLLAPHTQENPIFFHMTDSSTTAFKSAIDQMAEVGFEMLIYSFGSGFNIESTNETYIDLIAQDVAYANSKGIEVGGYDLIALSRGVEADWMAVDANNKSVGSACFASEWYDDLFGKFTSFIDRTNLSMVETDGPYGGYACHAEHHKHHNDVSDSMYMQNELQGKFYNTLRQRRIYINQPDNYFYQGGSKTGMGYNENQYSLPRWQDLSVSRQGMYDDMYIRIPSVGWMFVPLVQYHGGGKDAIFEPLSDHKLEYEWALAQYLGAGIAACYRGYRLYDSEETKLLVTKWVKFYKKYREILNSDIIHVRRADMQSIDSFMHVNPFIDNKALAMVFNPTHQPIRANLTLPLYYTGISNTAYIREQEGSFQKYTLDRRYNTDVFVDLGPMAITWFLVEGAL